ncbi:hypothetical protein GF312_03645 [Candidatus Poribacteria bacterium]|nr:hypothetical protein [Candidatus Poribacteria bacterium]
MSQTILKYRLRQIYNTLTRSPRRKKFGWVVSLSFLAPYYVMVIRSMGQIYGKLYENRGWEALSSFASVNLSLIFFFVMVSTTAITLYRILEAKDLSLLMFMPLEDKSLFSVKFYEALSDTLKGMILPFPVCIAFMSILGKIQSPLVVSGFLLGWIGIIFQLASLSVLIALLLGKLVTSKHSGAIMRMLAVISAMVFLVVFMGYSQRSDSISLSIETGTYNTASGLAKYTMFFPSGWLVKAVSPSGLSGFGLLKFSGFVLLTILLPILAFWLFSLRFRSIWLRSLEVKRSKKSHLRSQSIKQKLNEKTSSSKTKTMMKKELKIISREPHIWIGLTIPLVLFFLFLMWGSGDRSTQITYIILISFLTTLSYSLSSVGREGKTFLLLKSMPLDMSALVRAKLVMGCVFNLVLTITFSFVLYFMKGLTLLQLGLNLALSVAASIYTAAFGVSMAALFPKFDFTNPMRAAALPGIVFLYLLIVAFGGSLVAAFNLGWWALSVPLIIWAVVAVMLMKRGIRNLEKLDF